MIVSFIRHAQSRGNVGEKTDNPTTISLTENGKQQAHYLSEYLTKPDMLVVSSYIRTGQTAEPLQKKFPNVPCETWEIHEFTYLACHYQEMTNRQRAHFSEKYWKRGDPDYVDEARVESFNQFAQRIEYCIAKIDQMDFESLFVFTHGHVIRYLLLFLMTQNYQSNISKMNSFRFMRFFPVPNTCILEVDWKTKKIAPLKVQHLPNDILSL